MATSPNPVSARTFGRSPSRLDPIAPDWMVRLLAPKKAPVPWLDMVRTALTITLPLALAVALGQSGLGIFAGMGGLVGAFGDRGGTFRQRFRRTSAGAVAALLGLLIGRATSGQGVVAVLVVTVLAVVSGLLSSVSANLSFAGLQLLVYLAVAGSLPASVPLPALLAAFGVGVGWALALSFVQSRIAPPKNGARTTGVSVLAILATLLREPPPASDTEVVHAQRAEAMRQLSQAYDELVESRAKSAGRREDLRRLSAELTTTFGLVTACFDYVHAGGVPRPELAGLLDRLSNLAGRDDRLADRKTGHALRREISQVYAGVEPQLAPMLLAIAQVARALSGPAPAPARSSATPSGASGRRAATTWLLGDKAWVFAVRLAVTMTVAEAVRQLVPLEKSYWIVLTAALVLKPDLGSVFARGVQRTLGTLVGVVLGIAVLQIVPPGPLLLIPIALLALLFPYGASRNYGLLSTFITPLVLLLLDFGVDVGRQLAVDRLLDTMIGAGVVLVVGYLAWPTTWRPRLGEHVAVGVEALADYARVAFGADHQPIGPARRRAYRAMSDIRSELQSTLAEPPPLSRQAAAWWPLIAQLEKTTDDLNNVSFLARHESQRPPDLDVAMLGSGLDELAAALRSHRPPGRVPLPDSLLLADLASDVEDVIRMAAGPAAG